MKKRRRAQGYAGKILAGMTAGALVLTGAPYVQVQAAEGVIYAGGSGNSENSGLDSSHPVGSIYQAQAMLPMGGTIVITDPFYIDSEREYSLMEGITLKGADNLSGPLFQVAEGGSLSLNNIVIDGNEDTLISNEGVVKLNENVTFLNHGASVDPAAAVSTSESASTYQLGVLLEGIEESWENAEGAWNQESGTSEDLEGEEGNAGEPETDAQKESDSELETDVKETPDSEPETDKQETPDSEPETDVQETPESEPETDKQETLESQPETDKQETLESQPETDKQETPEGQPETDIQTEPETDLETEAQTEPTGESQEQEETSKETESQDSGSQEIESEKSQAVETFVKKVQALSVHGREDVWQVMEAADLYQTLSQEEQAQVPEEAVQLLESAKELAGAYNHTQQGVSVSGDIPWYVQFRVSVLDIQKDAEQGLQILKPYELTLWDLYQDEAYVLPEGAYVTVTMPAPEEEVDGEYTIFHYKADGSIETIHPVIEGDMMSFQTASFSPFSVAGSTIIAGVGVTSGNNSSTSGGSQKTESGSQNQETAPAGNGSTESKGTESPSKEETNPSSSGSSASQTESGSYTGGSYNGVKAPNTADTTGIWTLTAAAALSLGVILICRKGRRA